MPNSPITIRLRHSPGYTAWSHGWAFLAPFSEDGDFLGWTVDLPKGGPRHLAIRWSDQIPCDSEVRSYLGISPNASQKDVERVAAKRYGHWGRFTYLAHKFERVFAKDNYVDC